MKQIQTDGLSFDEIKANLKTFMQGQSEFDSYDFDGSALSVLLDLLAYNTHYNLLYTNLAVNESFIDSASKKASVVSLAKSLGYTAKSVISSKAIVTVTVTPPSGSSLDTMALAKGTVFQAAVGDKNYTFQPLSNYTATRDLTSGNFIFNNVELVEGTPSNVVYTVTDTSKYVIPNANVDTTTFEVLVSDNASSNIVNRFFYAEDILRLTGNDYYFFIKQREDLLFEVYFGNGVLGVAPVNGNVVDISYRVSAGEAANGASSFVMYSAFSSPFTIQVDTVQPARGGRPAEDIESVRFNAPRAWVTQNRAVTALDYETILQQFYPNIESVHAWGGQDNVPPVFGKIFIAAKPFNREVFDPAEKESMLGSLLLRRGVVTVIPEFVDPEYLNIELLCSVYYNENVSRWTGGELENIVRGALTTYSGTLNKFDSVFRFSKVSALVDASDSAITSNAMSLRVRVPVQPAYNIINGYLMTHNNPIEKRVGGGSFYTTRFFSTLSASRTYISDDGNGILKLYSEDVVGNPFFIRDVGTINYITGSWNIPSLTITSLYDPVLEFVFVPASNDVVSNRNLIVGIRNDILKVTAISDKIAAGVGTGGANFTFTAR